MADRVTISEERVNRLVKEVLGYGTTIGLGPTGRVYSWYGFDTVHSQAEEVELYLDEVAERANVLSEDDIHDAAIDGIRAWLVSNNAEIQRRINETAEAMRQEQLDTPFQWVVYGPENGVAAFAWRSHPEAERALADMLTRQPDARIVESINDPTERKD